MDNFEYDDVTECRHLAQELADALTVTSATTLAGVAAKFDMILREGQGSEECEEFPWRELRLALFDLVQIGQNMEPGSFRPGRGWAEP
ncbi:hypothetical protein Q0601_20005 [Paracoccus onubensis]|uniref:hypothetical protein n=1 Tax=Paracoccus onubensis TaxID=1675788 RepID=UPI00272EEC17|nr:hypothetical protein [Paracoccus onubensis]MDP0929475.1 hypothetical protein [Paracoccus onubensis]